MDHMVHHMSMSRREVLVQLDDDLVTRLDHLASERGTSRSELLRRGAMAVLDAEDLRRADEELQAAYRRIPQDSGIVQMATRLAASTIPEW
jgi:predicted transcriptional regulator